MRSLSAGAPPASSARGSPQRRHRMTDKPIIAVPMWPSRVRIPKSLRQFISKGVTLRHGLIQNIADGKWPRGLDGWLLKRRLRRAALMLCDWENSEIPDTLFASFYGNCIDNGALARVVAESAWHSDAGVHPVAAPCHLDYRGMGADEVTPGIPWTTDNAAGFMRRAIERHGLTAESPGYVFVGVKYTHFATLNFPVFPPLPTTYDPHEPLPIIDVGRVERYVQVQETMPIYIPIEIWLSMVRAALESPAVRGILLFGNGPELTEYLNTHAEKIKEIVT